jgi:16S rRNA (cytosine967-C5)-methyltransferase
VATAPTPSPPLARLLDAAADAVQAVRAGRPPDTALAAAPAELRPGAQALAFHALRWLGAAMVLRETLAPKPPPPPVDALLLTALALLWPTGEPPPYPDHTLVDQAVACARRRAPAAAAFVNAVLRRVVREREALAAQVRQRPLGAYNHPEWWIERVRHDWPTRWPALLEASNRHPPMTLRVHAGRHDAESYLGRLAERGLGGWKLEEPAIGGQAVQLARPCPVTALPGFADGDVSVQDAAAQRAAPLLIGGGPACPGVPALRHGARVLDACAAPGGKTAHLLERRPDLALLALDADAQRLERVRETLRRLHLDAALIAADARRPADWWDGRPFDAVLLDAPCTASGIVRRHPDVRWLRRPDDVATLAATQTALLDALWTLVAPGGRLLYATCSIFQAEGPAQIDAFLQRRPPGEAVPDPASPGSLLPLADNDPGPAGASGHAPAPGDGFFYALLHKTR